MLDWHETCSLHDRVCGSRYTLDSSPDGPPKSEAIKKQSGKSDTQKMDESFVFRNVKNSSRFSLKNSADAPYVMLYYVPREILRMAKGSCTTHESSSYSIIDCVGRRKESFFHNNRILWSELRRRRFVWWWKAPVIKHASAESSSWISFWRGPLTSCYSVSSPLHTLWYVWLRSNQMTEERGRSSRTQHLLLFD